MKEYLNPDTVTRVEDVPVELSLDKLATIERHKLALKILLNRDVDDFKVRDGDTLKVTWRLVLEYLGRTEMQLEALGDILDDPDIIVDAKCEPLEEGKILVFEVFRKLKKVIRKVRKQQAKKGHPVDIFIGGEKVATGKVDIFTERAERQAGLKFPKNGHPGCGCDWCRKMAEK